MKPATQAPMKQTANAAAAIDVVIGCKIEAPVKKSKNVTSENVSQDGGFFKTTVAQRPYPASARAKGPGSSRIGKWISAANRPSATAAHHMGA